ncbi:MAG: hypothetical protein HKP58_06110 [Desulfatitalea sp.]|nr:hypothetical protein [Desulfatitalea sp.]NNJ99970.1 hypothetical protein [Desulfatitalea sp.]
MKLLKYADLGSRPVWSAALGTPLERALALYRPLRHLLRVGIHHCAPLPDGDLLAVLRKRVLRIRTDGRAEVVMRIHRGNKPASKGVCVTPDGAVLISEYAQNLQRILPVSLYRSVDGGLSFERIFEFASGDVRHIHFVQWDPYEACLWMGTGDSDSESRLYRSGDNGENWELIGGGSQLWRAVGVAFRPEALYWGTDAGYDTGAHPNHVMRLDRATGELSKRHDLQGPCHGNAALGDDTLLVTTGVEGGLNEKDRFAHLWMSVDGARWHELLRLKKDFWPRLLQFGVIRFPGGNSSKTDILFTALGLAGSGETAFAGQLL